jgi:hypothetical protein
VGHAGKVIDKDNKDNNKMMLPDPGYLYYAEPKTCPLGCKNNV